MEELLKAWISQLAIALAKAKNEHEAASEALADAKTEAALAYNKYNNLESAHDALQGLLDNPTAYRRKSI